MASVRNQGAGSPEPRPLQMPLCQHISAKGSEGKPYVSSDRAVLWPQCCLEAVVPCSKGRSQGAGARAKAKESEERSLGQAAHNQRLGNTDGCGSTHSADPLGWTGTASNCIQWRRCVVGVVVLWVFHVLIGSAVFGRFCGLACGFPWVEGLMP